MFLLVYKKQKRSYGRFTRRTGHREWNLILIMELSRLLVFKTKGNFGCSFLRRKLSKTVWKRLKFFIVPGTQYRNFLLWKCLTATFYKITFLAKRKIFVPVVKMRPKISGTLKSFTHIPEKNSLPRKEITNVFSRSFQYICEFYVRHCHCKGEQNLWNVLKSISW